MLTASAAPGHAGPGASARRDGLRRTVADPQVLGRRPARVEAWTRGCECWTVTPGEVRIRARRPSDVPALAAALLAQQSQTHYPFRDPLPVPVEDFLHARDAIKAWTAELDGRPVGQVCRVGPAGGFQAADLLNEVCSRAHGCARSELAWVSTLFVATEARGRGLGRRLMEVVVGDLRRSGLHPCLEVLPTHPAAKSLYLAMGWQVVHRLRPDWLTAVAGAEGPEVHVMVLPDQRVGARVDAARG